ncbi:MAG: secretion protein HlyD family protein [Collimonas fungivorans]|uniref:HlyD family secretion protein n=1 Tax=Collimonas fungivorans TaxID=158899 RepID=UPI0026EDBC7B|nr:efflux RND transporter periplasmic adaptor subunit [Collimonas fungivorans]MDB5765389.1 secretion protein HlyD family protein [Collimonas fungivorans]
MHNNENSSANAVTSNDVPGPGQKRRIVIVVFLIVVAILGIGLWLAFRNPTDLVQGMADANSANVSTKITARVVKLQAKEGDRVTPGQVLFELASPEVAAKHVQATSALVAAQAMESKAKEGARVEDIRSAQANWKRAEASSVLAQTTYTRIENLLQEGVVTQQKRDEAWAQARSAAEQERAARAQYDQALAGARIQDKAAAAAQVRQAEGAVAEVQAAEDETLGRAPVAGEINKRMADIGELVPAGYPLFSVIDIDNMWVAFSLREDQFNGLRNGQRLHGDVPALGLRAVEFAVYFINPAGDFATWRATRQSAGYDVKSFEIRVRPVRAIPNFRPGMSVLFAWPQRG